MSFAVAAGALVRMNGHHIPLRLPSLSTKLFQCPYCGDAMRRARAQIPKETVPLMTRQHILPRRRGGTDRAENIKWCCKPCNTLLEAVDDCPGAMACAFVLGEALGLGRGHTAARGAIRRLRLHRNHIAAVSLDSHATLKAP